MTPQTPGAQTSSLVCEHVVVRFDRQTAVDRVSLRIGQGEVVALLGKSGAGKSTLLRCMNRLIEPDQGQITLFGEDITHVQGSALRSVRRRVGMIFQQFNLVSRLTVMQNVLSGRLSRTSGVVSSVGSLVRLFPRSETELAMRCLTRVGMAEYASRRADQLSGGQQQRVAIARTLAQEPQIILADEPIASLDPGSSQVVMQTLRAICQESGMPVVVSLHQVDAALAYADRVIAMKGGRVVMDRSTQGLTEAEVNLVYRDDSGSPPELGAGGAASPDQHQFLGANS